MRHVKGDIRYESWEPLLGVCVNYNELQFYLINHLVELIFKGQSFTNFQIYFFLYNYTQLIKVCSNTSSLSRHALT